MVVLSTKTVHWFVGCIRLACSGWTIAGRFFTELTPHPESEGEYGISSTVDGYLQTQEVDSYLQAEKSYREVITQMANAALSGFHPPAKSRSNKKKVSGFSYTDWILDPDPLILLYFNSKKIECSVETQKKLELHIKALYAWINGEILM